MAAIGTDSLDNSPQNLVQRRDYRFTACESINTVARRVLNNIDALEIVLGRNGFWVSVREVAARNNCDNAVVRFESVRHLIQKFTY